MPEHDYCLITGASGFLGTWLAREASLQGWRLIGVDIVAPQRPELFESFATTACDRADIDTLVGHRRLRAVFHLAGGASVPQSVENPMADFSSLLPGTMAVLAYMARCQREAHLVLYSSASVYGNPAELPIGEADRISPVSPYGIHKAMAEFAVSEYARLYELRASFLRIFSAYGEGLRKQVIWDVCQKIMAAVREGRDEIILHGTGEETRDFVHACDVARAAILIAKNPPAGHVQAFNVAAGVETSIRGLAEKMLSVLNSKVRLAFNGMMRKGDPLNWRADTRHLRNLGFQPEVSIEEGIRRSVSWQTSLVSRVDRPFT